MARRNSVKSTAWMEGRQAWQPVQGSITYPKFNDFAAIQQRFGTGSKFSTQPDYLEIGTTGNGFIRRLRFNGLTVYRAFYSRYWSKTDVLNPMVDAQPEAGVTYWPDGLITVHLPAEYWIGNSSLKAGLGRVDALNFYAQVLPSGLSLATGNSKRAYLTVRNKGEKTAYYRFQEDVVSQVPMGAIYVCRENDRWEVSGGWQRETYLHPSRGLRNKTKGFMAEFREYAKTYWGLVALPENGFIRGADEEAFDEGKVKVRHKDTRAAFQRTKGDDLWAICEAVKTSIRFNVRDYDNNTEEVKTLALNMAITRASGAIRSEFYKLNVDDAVTVHVPEGEHAPLSTVFD